LDLVFSCTKTDGKWNKQMLKDRLSMLEQVLIQTGKMDNSLRDAIKALTDINFALDEALIVAITDVKGNITFANENFCRISKYAREELIGQNHRIINSGYHSNVFFRDMWQTIATGQIWRGEIKNKAKDKTLYWMDTIIVPIANELGKPYQYVSFRNEITERKETEAFLRRAESITAVGQMASGLAHEIRNPLAAIQWTLQLLNVQNPEDKARLEAVFSELQRVNNIVSELLVLAKPHETKVLDVQLDDVLALVVNLMNGQARHHHVVLRTEIESTPPVRCDPNQLKQVFMNLIKNAIEATLNGGEVQICIGPIGKDEVRIRVVDQGIGIPEDILVKLGEPFFSTKNKGTGLGIMVCHKIIQDHHGKMNIQSKVNEGTIVDIILPVSGAF